MFTRKQLEVYHYDHIYKPLFTICDGAVRSGKTYVDNVLWLKHVYASKGKGYKYIMTGATVASLKRNVLDDLESMFNIDTTLNKNNEFTMFGNIVACFGADKSNSYKAMKGFTAHGWYANEVTEHHRSSVDQAIKRCSGHGSRIFWDTNPANPNHYIKTEYLDRDGALLSDGRVHIKRWHFKLDDNSFLPDWYRESLKKSIPSGHYYDRDILGLWVSAEGMIYKDFDYGKHVIDYHDLPDIKEYWCGVDFGYDHKGIIALYGQDHDGKAYRIREIAERERSIDFWIKTGLDIKERYGNILMYCDTARPDYISDMRQAGLNVRGAQKDVIAGIGFVSKMYKNNRLFIVKQYNGNYLQEIYNYRWLENAKLEAPIKENDDSMDSERYALYSHIGKERKIKPTTAIM